MKEKIDEGKATASMAGSNGRMVIQSTKEQTTDMFDYLIERTLEIYYPKTLRENTEAFEDELARATEALDDFIEMRLLEAMNVDIEKAAEDAKEAFAKAMAEERMEATAFR